MELAAREVVPALLNALGQLTILVHHFALLGFVELSPLALLVVNQKQILHVIGPPCPSADSRTACPIIDNLQKFFSRGFRAPALVSYLHGRPYSVLCFNMAGGEIRNIYIVSNPDKLTRLPGRSSAS